MAGKRATDISDTRNAKKQRTLRDFGRVTKAATSTSFKDKSVTPSELCHSAQLFTSSGKKRRRENGYADEPEDQESLGETACIAKKPRLQLPTPPSSQKSEDASPTSPTSLHCPSLHRKRARQGAAEELSPSLHILVGIHKSFLKALSVHYAHNGLSTPAELKRLLESTTRIWKRNKVQEEDIRRILALYEIAADYKVLLAPEILQKNGPFRLISTSLASHIEYVGEMSNPSPAFNSHCLQVLFEADLQALVISSRTESKLSFLAGPLSSFPVLSVSVGSQTVANQQKLRALRSEVLFGESKSQPQKILEERDSDTEHGVDPPIPVSVKSRTQSLFDRVKQKHLANMATSRSTPTTILRRHAIGHIAEVIEILRMKQQQKIGTGFISSVHVSPSKARARTSFSVGQLVREIQNSLSVPMGEHEIRTCLKILAEEIPGFWVTWLEVGNSENPVASIVLNGCGPCGREIQNNLEMKERKYE